MAQQHCLMSCALIVACIQSHIGWVCLLQLTKSNGRLIYDVLQAYVLSEELNEWLLFDDTKIRYIGSWQNVVKDMQEARLQPSLLFYERFPV